MKDVGPRLAKIAVALIERGIAEYERDGGLCSTSSFFTLGIAAGNAAKMHTDMTKQLELEEGIGQELTGFREAHDGGVKGI